MRQSTRVHALVVGVTALGLAGCAGGSSGQQHAAHGGTSGQAPVHIHAVVVQDEQTFLGTHEGLFRLVDGRAVRVSDQPFDVMSLAASPGLFVASGHPAPGTDFPDPLGLGVSSDGGRSWKSISRLGVTDFHDVEIAGSRVWGLASDGALWRSEDGGDQWETSAHPGLHDVAVDPADPDRVLALSEAGLLVSNDGGTTFAPAEPPPPSTLVKVLWLGDEQVAVTATGDVVARTPGPGAWVRRGAVPAGAEAVTTTGRDVVVAAMGAIYRSTDAGASFVRTSSVSW